MADPTADMSHQSFIVTQATFSAMPIFFFVLASIFSILTIVSTALIFLVLFWTGFAITIIAPILLISSAFALFFWAFGVVLFTVGSSALALVATADSTSDAPSGGNGKQRPRLPAATPSSSSATSWVKSEGRDIKKEETSGTDKLASVHPAPGSDVDALEP